MRWREALKLTAVHIAATFSVTEAVHAFYVNDVRVAIARAATTDGMALEQWVDEATLKSDHMRDYVTVPTAAGHRRRDGG